MSIYVSEPGRPTGTRLPEIFRGRRVGSVTEIDEPQRSNVRHSEATDAEFQRAAAMNSGRHRALEEYGTAVSGEYKEQRPYLPVSRISTPVIVSLPASSSVTEALETMDQRGVSHLVVIAEGNVAGLVELRWLLAWLHENGSDPSESSLVNLELPAFLTASPETDAHQLARLMLAHQLNAALIIAPDGQPAGIVTSTDYLRLYADAGRHEGDV